MMTVVSYHIYDHPFRSTTTPSVSVRTMPFSSPDTLFIPAHCIYIYNTYILIFDRCPTFFHLFAF